MICGVLISAGMWSGARVLAGIFLDSSEHAFEIAKNGLPLLGLCALPFALNITYIGYYQSCERSGLSTTYMLMRGIIFMVPGFILLPLAIGASGLWLAIPASELLTLAFIAISILFNRKKIA